MSEISKQIIGYVRLLNKSAGSNGRWINPESSIYNSKTEYNKFYKDYKEIFLTVKDVKNVLEGENINVIDNNYSKVSTLTKKKIMSDDETKLGIFTNFSKNKLAYTNEYHEPWIIVNENTFEILKNVIDNEIFVNFLKERRKELDKKKDQ